MNEAGHCGSHNPSLREAKLYLGKYVLVGITYLDIDGNLVEKREFHGDIVRINEREGLVIKLRNSDQEYKLPPALHTLEPASKGEYCLHSTGEIVVDPDFTTVWTSRKRIPHEGELHGKWRKEE